MNILILLFCFEWQFPAVNMIILLFLFWMTVPAGNKLVLLLLLFHFYFYFHFIIKMFCFVLTINKMNLFPIQWKQKKNWRLSLYFQYKIIKVESKINKLMSFWRMAVVGHHTSVNCWVQKNCFWNSIIKLKKKDAAVNWSTVCCWFCKQLGKLQAIFAGPNNYVSSNMIFSSCSIMYFPTCIIGKEQMYILDYFRTCW